MKNILEACPYIIESEYSNITAKNKHICDESDYLLLYIQRYKFADSYKNITEQDINIIIEFFNQLVHYCYQFDILRLSCLNKLYDYRIYHYVHLIISKILGQLYKHNLLDTIVDKLPNIFIFYNLCSKKRREQICICILKHMIKDFQLFSYQENMFHYIDNFISHNKQMNFNDFINDMFIKVSLTVDNELYQMLNFDSYKRRFYKIMAILRDNKRFQFLNTEDYNKHTEYLIKTAQYKNTKDYEIQNALYLNINDNVNQRLSSILLLKKL